MRAYKVKELEQRMAVGARTDLVFATIDGEPMAPDNLRRDWIRISRQKGLPKVSLHALRHSHASALIASGLDVLTVSRRLGHGSPVVTLNTYSHLFAKMDTAAAAAIDRVLK